MNVKLKWLREKIKSLELQGMIVSNPVNIRYLTGIEAEGVLLITLKENLFITDSRYVEAVNSFLTLEDEIVVFDRKNLTKEDYTNIFMFSENVGFEEYYVSYHDYTEMLQKYRVNLMETEKVIESLRTIKDENEIKYIEKACEITDNCFDYLKEFIKIGMTEKEIASEIECYFKKNAEGISFEPIVASGHNSSMPHVVPGNRKIKDGDIILIDMGCKYKGYCSDMTRMLFVGYVDEEFENAYNICLNNNIEAENAIKDGRNIKVVAQNSNNDLKQKGFTPLHSLGHGVGLDVHEEPLYNTNIDQGFKENMVVTVEPGVYKTGQFGIRIEDTLVVEKEGARVLTKSSKEPIIIKG